MQPKISIIIPVYNVAPYLRQCLDSVVNQTLRDIQVVCVDHTSTDGSRAILNDFADKDARIQIIDCPNTGGGPGQARNAALPHIKGTYTYFVDSDDWLDTQLCEKTSARMDETGCDILILDFHSTVEQGQKTQTRVLKSIQHKFPRSGKDGTLFLDYYCTPWSRVLRTSWIQKHDLRYLEGCMPEDRYFHWIQMANNPHVEMFGEKLYYYRLHQVSQMGTKGEYVARTPQIFLPIRDYLEKNNCYPQFKEKYLLDKANSIYSAYYLVRPEYRKLCKTLAIQSFQRDEILELRECNKIPFHIKQFLLALSGDMRAQCFMLLQNVNKFLFQPWVRKIEFHAKQLGKKK